MAEPVITRIVRTKLRATLRRDDGREHNLDALDVLGEIRLRLVRKLAEAAESAESIASLDSYAAMVAYNCCSDYLRARYPKRNRLKNAVRRLLEKSGDLAVWQESSAGDWMCGYAGWRQNSPGILKSIAPPGGSIDAESPAGLYRLMTHVLDALGSPVGVDDLVAWIGQTAGVQDYQDEGLDTAASAGGTPGGESSWMARERMRLLFDAIRQLLPWHRAAYLLNLRDGELDAFPYYGVASIEQIREVLEFAPEQAARLAAAIGVSASLSPTLQFASCWRHLPADDNLIAEILQVTRPQVIAYRNKAVERLRRSLQSIR